MSTPAFHRRRRAMRAASVLAVAVSTRSLQVFASTYIGASGSDWNTTTNWNPTGVPGSGAAASIIEAPASLFTVSFDTNYTSAAPIGTLTLDSTTANAVQLNQTLSADNLFASSEVIAQNGKAIYNQSAATNSFGTAFIGQNGSSSGTYSLSGTGVFSVGAAEVGVSGSGTFNQSGGTVVETSFMTVGNNAGGSGTYNFSAGVINSNYLNLGYTSASGTLAASTGTMIQTGGTATYTSGMTAGVQAGTTGVYSLSGSGLLTVNGPAYVGSSGTGNFTQSGGTATFAGSGDPNGNGLSIADQSGSHGTYNLTAGALTVVQGETVGTGGAGTFLQSGGTNTASTGLNIGYTGGTGIYSLSNTGLLTTPGGEFIGVSAGTGGTGTFNQSGGTNSLTGNTALFIGDGASGVYNLSGGSLSAHYIEIAGYNGSPVGTFNQSGGSNTASGIDLGYSAGSNGTYTLSSGQLTTVGGIFCGYGGTGTFVQTGGTVSVTAFGGAVGLGEQAGAVGAYTLSGGSLTVQSIEVGIANAFSTLAAGVGTFVESTTTATATANVADLLLGMSSGTTGRYTLSGANATLSVTTEEDVGSSGSGTFIQTGGTHTVTSSASLYVGKNSGSTGFYSLTSTGVLSVGSTAASGGVAYVGYGGSGSFTQFGATSSYNGEVLESLADYAVGLSIGHGASGAYTLTSSGSLSVTQAAAAIGDTSSGTFKQLNGTANLSGFDGSNGGGLYIGLQPTGQGLYALSGGNLNVTSGAVIIGQEGSGTFSQTGGTASFTASTLQVFTAMVLGLSPNSVGLYLLGGGTLVATQSEYIGYQGAGTFSQSGGTHSLVGSAANLSIALSAGSTSAYSLSGTGQLSVGGSAYVGGGSSASGGAGSLLISGGTMTVNETLKVWNSVGSSVSLSGGTLNLIALDLSGNPALLNWTGGTLNFMSGLGLTVDSNFVLGSSLTLNTSMTLAAGTTLTNNGQITLNGGALSSAGAMTNNSQITGNGAIAGGGGFTNAGQLTQSGGNLTLSIAGANTNAGNITLSSNQFQLTGGSLTNSGTITLNGSTINGTAQLSNSAAGVITGAGTITASLTNFGTIVPSGGSLTVPPLTNNGTIAPGSFAASLSGGLITNAQNIEGIGQINNAITNNGLVSPSGGRLTLTGAVSNSASGQISVATGAELDINQGLNANTGTISLTGGTLNTGSSTLINGATGQITGYGTLRTGGLTNNGALTLTGGTSTVNGPVTNAAGQTINIKYQPAIFTGAITNNGTIKTTNTTVTFTGPYSGNAYVSDPSDNIFQNNVTIVPGGEMTGGSGDRYFFSGGTFSNQGTFTNGGLLQSSDATVNSGTFVESGTQQWSTGTTFTNTAGSATFATDTGSATASPLMIGVTGGTVSLAASQHLGGLSVIGAGSLGSAAGSASAAAPLILNITNLILSSGGKFDLTNNELLTQSTTAAVRAEIVAGSLFTSSTGGALGYLDAGGGQTEVRFTILGDTNLDGQVNVSDLGNLATNFGTTTGASWIQGDFDYNGSVNVADLGDLATNFGATVPGGAAAGSASTAAASAVPEPTALALLTLAATTMLPRRRRPT